MTAKNNTKTAARNVAIDLLGDSKPNKGKVVKAAAKGKKDVPFVTPVKEPKAKGKGKGKATATIIVKGKSAAKLKAASGKVGRPSKFVPAMKIKVVKERECRDGTPVAKVWNMVKKAKTVGDFIAMRKRAKLDGELGGYFPMFVNEKCIRVSA